MTQSCELEQEEEADNYFPLNLIMYKNVCMFEANMFIVCKKINICLFGGPYAHIHKKGIYHRDIKLELSKSSGTY